MASRSSRNHFVDPPSLVERLYDGLPQGVAVQLQARLGHSYTTPGNSASGPRQYLRRVQQRFRWNWKAVFNLPHALILLWLVVLWWGERTVFRKTIEACEWHNWERWVRHIIFAFWL